MPKLLATCQRCASRVPLPIDAVDGARLVIRNHTATFPCPHCGGAYPLQDIYVVYKYNAELTQGTMTPTETRFSTETMPKDQ